MFLYLASLVAISWLQFFLFESKEIRGFFFLLASSLFFWTIYFILVSVFHITKYPWLFGNPWFPALIFGIVLANLLGSSECVAHRPGGIWLGQVMRKPLLLSVSIDLFSWQSKEEEEESACNAEQASSIPGAGRSPGYGYLFRYTCLENSMGREAWWTTAHGIPESDTTKWLTLSHFYTLLLAGSDSPEKTITLLLGGEELLASILGAELNGSIRLAVSRTHPCAGAPCFQYSDSCPNLPGAPWDRQLLLFSLKRQCFTLGLEQGKDCQEANLGWWKHLTASWISFQPVLIHLAPSLHTGFWCAWLPQLLKIPIYLGLAPGFPSF